MLRTQRRANSSRGWGDAFADINDPAKGRAMCIEGGSARRGPRHGELHILAITFYYAQRGLVVVIAERAVQRVDHAERRLARRLGRCVFGGDRRGEHQCQWQCGD